MRFTTMIAGAAVVLTAAGILHGQNRASNPSFEQGLTGWNATQGTIVPGQVGKAVRLGTAQTGCTGLSQESNKLLDPGRNLVLFSFRSVGAGKAMQADLDAMMPQVVVGGKPRQPGTFYKDTFANYDIAGNVRPGWIQAAVVFDLPNSTGGGRVSITCDQSASEDALFLDEVYAVPLTNRTPFVHGAAVRTDMNTNGNYEALWNGNAPQGPLQFEGRGYLYFVAKAPGGAAWTLSMTAQAVPAPGGAQPVQPAIGVVFYDWQKKLWVSAQPPPPGRLPHPTGNGAAYLTGAMKPFPIALTKNLPEIRSGDGYVLGRLNFYSDAVCGIKGQGCPPFDVRMKELQLK